MIDIRCSVCALHWIGGMQAAFDAGWGISVSGRHQESVYALCPRHNRPVPLPFKTEALKHDERGRAAAKYFSVRTDEATEAKLLEVATDGEAMIRTTAETWRERLWKTVVGFVRVR